jgi:hypothetical protein
VQADATQDDDEESAKRLGREREEFGLLSSTSYSEQTVDSRSLPWSRTNPPGHSKQICTVSIAWVANSAVNREVRTQSTSSPHKH